MLKLVEITGKINSKPMKMHLINFILRENIVKSLRYKFNYYKFVISIGVIFTNIMT